MYASSVLDTSGLFLLLYCSYHWQLSRAAKSQEQVGGPRDLNELRLQLDFILLTYWDTGCTWTCYGQADCYSGKLAVTFCSGCNIIILG